MRSLRAFMRLVDKAISKYGTTRDCLAELEPILFSPPPPPRVPTLPQTHSQSMNVGHTSSKLRADLRWVVCIYGPRVATVIGSLGCLLGSVALTACGAPPIIA